MTSNSRDVQPSNGADRLLVVLNEDVKVETIDASSGERLGIIDTPRMPHEAVVDDASGLAYVCITYQDGYYNKFEKASNYIQVVDLEGFREVDVIDISPHVSPHGIALSPDREKLYLTCESDGGELVVLDLPTKKVVGHVSVQAHGPHWMSVLPDETKAYTANKEDPFVSVVNLQAMELITTIPTPSGTEGIVATPDSKRVFASSQRTPELYVIDTETDTVEDIIALPERPGALATTPDGSKILITTFNFTYWEAEPQLTQGYLQVLDAATLQPGERIPVGHFPINVISSPDGARAFVSNFKDNTVSVVQLETMTSNAWPVGVGPHGIVFVPARS